MGITMRGFLLTIVTALATLAAASADDEGFYSVHDDPTWRASDVLKDWEHLPLTEEGSLATNLLLYSHTPTCQAMAAESWGIVYPSLRDAHPIEGALHEAYFGYPHSAASSSSSSGSNDVGVCAAICLIKGMRRDHLMYPLPTQMWRAEPGQPAGDAQMLLNEFLLGCQRVEIGFVSTVQEPLAIWWLSAPDKVEYQGELLPGDAHTMWQESSIGHIYQFALHDSDEILYERQVEHDSFFVIGERTSGKMNITMRAKIRNTLDREWGRSRRVKRTFTPLGFARSQLPLDLFASMATYYDNNRDNLMLEDWESDGYLAHVNWWEVDVFMVGMPWGLKRYWQARLKELVEAWSGVELELTDIYGMRRYEDGARLLSHVDREATHAASLIINVAQGDVREPWAIEVYDHADRLHEITMSPGDIVYYESARCLHGRMKPLVGGFYVNLFAHYRPTGDPDWFKQGTGSPAPLTDGALGDCRTTEKNTTACTSGANVPFLTLPVERISGPDDLFSYWQRLTDTYHLPDQTAGMPPPGTEDPPVAPHAQQAGAGSDEL